jgi:hypothetical protein
MLTDSVADTVVKVPQMAESITEGTLKQWSKRAYPVTKHPSPGTWH